MNKNRLTLIKKTNQLTKDGHYLSEFECTCGNHVFLLQKTVLSGNTKSCGCLRKEVARESVSRVRKQAATSRTLDGKAHGMSGTRIYRIWRAIIGRTTNPNNDMYYCYGGRGITICDKWKNSFSDFYADMKNGYEEDLTIDRIDNEKGYFQENCRWVTTQENNSNRLMPKELNGRFVKKYKSNQ